MLGGYQILDLRSIDLSRGTSESSISDVNVLSQLLNLRDHIQKTYDFSKPLHAQLKPLLIRYRDKKVGEKHEVACYGNIEVINTYYKFRIIANNEGEQLTINVEFEEKTDEYYNKYWDIKTAKILLTSEVAIFENITDKDGHNRFIEGDITIEDITGITQLYGKWSLSGSHLLIVVAITIASGVTLTGNQTLCKLNLPQWIKDKIVTLYGATYFVDNKNVYMVGVGTDHSEIFVLRKNADNIYITNPAYTSTREDYARVEFDLLIDNE